VKKQTLTILVLSLFLISAVSMAGSNCSYSGDKSKAEKTVEATKAKAEGETITLSVSNMTCGACVNHVTKVLTAVEGVKDVNVSLKEGKAEVVCDPAKVKTETLTAAVVKAGYPAKLATADAAVQKSVHKCASSCAKKCDPAACGMKAKTASAGEGDSK
jgi:copper chaperone CopZ